MMDWDAAVSLLLPATQAVVCGVASRRQRGEEWNYSTALCHTKDISDCIPSYLPWLEPM